MADLCKPVMNTDLPLPNRRSGKVRDIYDVPLADGSPGLLIVATDRLSAFDVIMATGLPRKGAVLTQISTFWFNRFKDLVPHHLVSTDAADIPGLSADEREPLEGRIVIGRKTKVVPIECIVRGYLAGSGFTDYQRDGAICGISLPPGMKNGEILPEPIFTPSTKADEGHDENISYEKACDLEGAELMGKLRDLSIEVYSNARAYAAERGVIIADTKFEFGVPLDGSSEEPILIDEVLTPDSSRFWREDEYTPGEEQRSLDKQYVRDYLQGLVDNGEWDKTPPGLVLPDSIVENTMARYREAFEMLTGTPFPG